MKITVFLLGVFVGIISNTEGRELEIESFQPSPETDTNLIDFGTIRMKKVKKNEFAITGTLFVYRNFGNEATLVLEAFTSSQRSLFKVSKPVCEFLNSETMIVPDIRLVSNIPPKGTCPIPKGNYTILNYKIDEKKFGFAPPGKYTGRVKFIQDGKIIAALSVPVTLKI